MNQGSLIILEVSLMLCISMVQKVLQVFSFISMILMGDFMNVFLIPGAPGLADLVYDGEYFYGGVIDCFMSPGGHLLWYW